ncbi:IS5 family transposase [Desulfocurvibacter africanus]|nr:IS5 family transposase [Desulfocurvibacter africanus]
MYQQELSDSQWARVKDYLPAELGRACRPARDNRQMVNAILYIMRTGAPWRYLPKEYGPWQSAYTRYSRWTKAGVWKMVLGELSKDREVKNLLIDSTYVKAHQHSSGAKGGRQPQAIGRSRGGLTSKIHASVDDIGLPVDIFLSAGQTNDKVPAWCLVEGRQVEYVVADKAYDSESLVTFIEAHGAQAVIPPRRCSKPRDYDREIYKKRNLIERFFNKIKHHRRIATRYDKLARNYLAWVTLAVILLWLGFENRT